MASVQDLNFLIDELEYFWGKKETMEKMYQEPAAALDSHLLSELICCRVNDEIELYFQLLPPREQKEIGEKSTALENEEVQLQSSTLLEKSSDISKISPRL